MGVASMKSSNRVEITYEKSVLLFQDKELNYPEKDISDIVQDIRAEVSENAEGVPWRAFNREEYDARVEAAKSDSKTAEDNYKQEESLLKVGKAQEVLFTPRTAAEMEELVAKIEYLASTVLLDLDEINSFDKRDESGNNEGDGYYIQGICFEIHMIKQRMAKSRCSVKGDEYNDPLFFDVLFSRIEKLEGKIRSHFDGVGKSLIDEVKAIDEDNFTGERNSLCFIKNKIDILLGVLDSLEHWGKQHGQSYIVIFSDDVCKELRLSLMKIDNLLNK